MELTKAFEFLRKNKSVILLPIICFMHFLASFYYDFWIVATVFSVFLLLISDFSHMLYYMIFFQMFSVSGKFSLINTYAFAILVAIKYTYGLIKKTENIYPFPFFMTLFICIFYSLFAYSIDAMGIYQGSSLIVAFIMIYLIFTYRHKFTLQKCADFLISGILSSALVALMVMLFQNSSTPIFDNLSESMRRLRLMTSNENSLAIYCSLTLSYYVHAMINKQGNLAKNIIFSLVCISIGLSTLSKCFFVVCVFIAFYLLFMLISKYKLHSFVFVIPIIIVLALMALAFKSTITTIISRFFSSFGSDSFFNELTTGRAQIWTQYINAIRSSIPTMLFGFGFFNERLVRIGPHNLFIHLLYRMGFVGLLLIGILIYAYIQSSSKTKKLTLKNCLPLLVFLMISLVEGFL